MLGELADAMNVSSLGAGREAGEVHVADHALAKTGHCGTLQKNGFSGVSDPNGRDIPSPCHRTAENARPADPLQNRCHRTPSAAKPLRPTDVFFTQTK